MKLIQWLFHLLARRSLITDGKHTRLIRWGDRLTEAEQRESYERAYKAVRRGK